MLARRNWDESLQARRFSPHHFGPNCRQVLYLPPANSSLLNIAKVRCSSVKVK